MKISVITPSLNSGNHIESAISSVLNQDYANFEHIVVDGGSTDNTIQILRKYKHLIWISEPDKGQSEAMNKGFEISTGDIIVYLNADDYFKPSAFFTVLPHFLNGENFVVGQVEVYKKIGFIYINDPKINFYQMLKWWEKDSYCCNPVGYFYRRIVQESIGGFNISSHHSMDYEFLLEASQNYSFAKINKVLGVFRLIEGTKTFASRGSRYFKKKFNFVDRFLEDLDEKYIQLYIKERKIHIQKVVEDELFFDIIANYKSRDYIALKDKIFELLKYLYNNPLRFFFRVYKYLQKVIIKSN